MKKNRFSKAARKHKAEQEKLENQQNVILQAKTIKNLKLLHSYIESNYDLIQEFIDFLKQIDNFPKLQCRVNFWRVDDFNLDKWLDDASLIGREHNIATGGDAVFNFFLQLDPSPKYFLEITFRSLPDESKLTKPEIKIQKIYVIVGQPDKYTYPWADTELELEQALDILVKEITPAIAD